MYFSYSKEARQAWIIFFSYTDILKCKELYSLVKIFLILSHGQAAVEREFGINNSLSKVNTSEQSLVCKKIVRDLLISNQLNPHTVPITDQFMRSVALVYQKYKKSLENKKSNWEKENCFNEKRKTTKEIAAVTQKYEQF